MAENKENNTCGTGGGCGCSGTTANQQTALNKTDKKQINIEFLYLDLNVCEQCKGTESGLEEALAEVSGVLSSAGVGVNLKRVHVESYEQALRLNFISSPTIRINGRDIALEVKENYCSSCSELSGEETYCRVWNFQGEQFSTAPKSMVIEAVLKEVYGSGVETDSQVISEEQVNKSLENLKRFFEGQSRQSSVETNTAIYVQTILPTPAKQAVSSAGCGCS